MSTRTYTYSNQYQPGGARMLFKRARVTLRLARIWRGEGLVVDGVGVVPVRHLRLKSCFPDEFMSFDLYTDFVVWSCK